MGYTHYWYIKTKEFSDTKWDNLLRDVNKVMKNLPPHFLGDGGSYSNEPITIKNWEGNGSPEFNNEGIYFNGDSSKGLDHESFVLEKKLKIQNNRNLKKELDKLKTEGVFNFCKTSRKPYSFLVEVTLLLAKKHFGSQISLSSDGRYDDWKFVYKYSKKMFPTYNFKPALLDMEMRETKEQKSDNVWLSIDLTQSFRNGLSKNAPDNFVQQMLNNFNKNGVKFKTYHNGKNRIYVNYTNMLDDERYYAFGQYNNSNEFSNSFVKRLSTPPSIVGKKPIEKWSNW